ncbi:hypothetical protein [Moorena producens]
MYLIAIINAIKPNTTRISSLLFPVPYSLFPIPYSLLPTPYSLLPFLP